MGAWGTAIFSDDLAADVRGDWRELILDRVEADQAAARVIESYRAATEDEDDSIVFWLALAAAQMETGRLQDEVRDRALTIIDSGGDVDRWASDDESAARQRAKVLDRLARKLRGPQSPPKRLRRRRPLGVSFDIGDAIRFRSKSGAREALAVVLDHQDGLSRGAKDPIIELLAWEGPKVPTVREMQAIPTLLTQDRTGLRTGYRNLVYVISTHLPRNVFSEEMGEVVARGVDKRPLQNRSLLGGGLWTTWSGMQVYLDQEYESDLRYTLEVEGRSWLSRLLRRS